MSMQDKTAIVTGGGRGIGRAIGLAFVQAGARVIIAEKNAESGRACEALLQKQGQADFIETDVAEERSVHRMVEETLKRTGQIDCLVNNAGIMVRKPIEERTLQEWQAVIGVNLTGAFLCAKYAAPALRRTRGAIVNISSTRALMSEPHTEAYAASKAGLLGLTHCLAVSLVPEVRVNCVSPGWIDTAEYADPPRPLYEGMSPADHEQHPCGRIGRPEDIAGMVLYLCSEQAGFITGQNFVIDGGMTKKMIYVE